MNRWLRNLVCLMPLLASIGCGSSVTEEPPPTEPRKLSPEEQKHMEDEVERMRKMYQSPPQRR